MIILDVNESNVNNNIGWIRIVDIYVWIVFDVMFLKNRVSGG